MQYLTAVCLNNAVMSFSAVVELLNIMYSLDDEAYGCYSTDPHVEVGILDIYKAEPLYSLSVSSFTQLAVKIPEYFGMWPPG